MKLVAFADLHLDRAFTWAPSHVARRRRSALRSSLERILQLADDVDADAILCAGDLYEQDRFTPDTTAFLQQMFAETHRRVFIAPGNHDWYGPGSIYASVEWSDNVHVFTEAELTPVEITDGFTLWGAAHCAPANTPGFFDSGFRADREGVNLALFHGSERLSIAFEADGKQPHSPFAEDQIADAEIDFAIVGHYHTPKDAQRFIYPGNPDPLTFGENGGGRAVVVEVDGTGDVTHERHDVSVSCVHDIVLDVTGCHSSSDVEERLKSRVGDLMGCVRVTVEGELDADVALRLRDLQDADVDVEALIVRQGRLRHAYQLEMIAVEQTVRGQFVRDVQEAELNEEDRERILTIGLRALDHRDDLEVA
jgi:DNA repair protein SbcD/Mre11